MTAGAPDQAATRAPRPLLQGIALQAALLVAVLVVAEIVLRLVDIRYLREGHRVGHTIAYNHDPELGWAPIPNAKSLYWGLHTINIAHNSLGLRDIEPVADGRKTVLFVGDSFVWGSDVEAPDRFTDRLRDELPQLRIVNAGVAGYGNDQQYLLLRRIWDRIKPDVVVLIYCVDNDRRDNSTNSRYDGYLKPYFAVTAEGRWLFQGQPVPRPRQAYFTDNVIARNSWVARLFFAAYVQLAHPAVTVPDPTERLIGMIRELAVSRGARFMVGMQRHEQQLETFLQAQDIAHVTFDGAEQFAGDGDHWTPKGHVLVAQRLKELLTRTGNVP